MPRKIVTRGPRLVLQPMRIKCENIIARLHVEIKFKSMFVRISVRIGFKTVCVQYNLVSVGSKSTGNIKNIKNKSNSICIIDYSFSSVKREILKDEKNVGLAEIIILTLFKYENEAEIVYLGMRTRFV